MMRAQVSLAECCQHTFGAFTVDVIDSVADYLEYMREIFDFPALRCLFEQRRLRLLMDCMHGGTPDARRRRESLRARARRSVSERRHAVTGQHAIDGATVLAQTASAHRAADAATDAAPCAIVAGAVTGPYARRIFVDELGASPESVTNAVPLPDFGGGHPDPNLTYAHALVERMHLRQHDLGAASDGDGDRNMILGFDAFFVTPCDSVAVIAANAQCIPYFRRTGIKGLARSMPTSGALDRVAAALRVECFEVPTGWKFFGNLMDAGRLSICGEESFGTGSDHIREKDGLWSVLAWLSILADRRATVADVLRAHWRRYGRNFFTRYDYEECDADAAHATMAHLQGYVANPGSLQARTDLPGGLRVTTVDDFSYCDPIDKSVTKNQGIRILLDGGARIVFRLSGTGSTGATIRLYAERYVAPDSPEVTAEPQAALKPVLELALELSQLARFTGRHTPTVVT